MTVVSFSMAYRSFWGGSGRLDTHLDTPPSINRRHLDSCLALLFAAQASRGWLQGVVQPMMFSVQSKAVGPHRQGSVVGLRQTMNRLAAIFIPPMVGGIAD